MAISRFKTSSVAQGLPKYQKLWDQSTLLGPGGVSPTGLHSWYDASNAASITSSGGVVSQWNDLSGNNRHAVQSSSTARPTTGSTTQNGRNVINFDGTQQFLLAPASVTSNALTMFSVYKRLSGGQPYGRIISLHNSGGNDYDNTNSLVVHATAASLGGVTAPLTGAYRASAHIAGSTINYGTAYLYSATLDGGNYSQNNSGTVVTGTTSTTSLNSNQLDIGAGGPYGGGDQFFYGWFAEQIIFTRVLTPTEITTVRNYLSAKWGV